MVIALLTADRAVLNLLIASASLGSTVVGLYSLLSFVLSVSMS